MDGGAQEIVALVEMLSKLPGLGPRSARRVALHLVKRRTQVLVPLGDMMKRVAENIRECGICGNFCTGELCDICLSRERDSRIICVVQDVADLWAMERGGDFSGRYHVLGGLLSYIDDVGPETLRIPQLIERVRAESVAEAILALSATVDGQTTVHYIAEKLVESGVSVSTLGQGVPIGGELDYLDDGTISAALKSRKTY
ncbi:MAG: recombination mediator RecR [Albidovulum sp.]|nr:recombination mediator RecR [Albidovulum sp.]MDE0304287.1 recombination mediator RecR [Albidovulum sp.]MDE0531574.1 recombination mediator RecR [Albidovulum sp.]